MQFYQQQLNELKQQNQLRDLKNLKPLPDGFAEVNGMQLINLSSNDYLGLGTDKNLKMEFMLLINDHPEWTDFTSSSSRMLSGNYALYNETEELIGNLYNRSALFFNSGYHLNLAALPALTKKDDLILSDKLVHASLIDGIKLSSAQHIRYRHNDYNQLIKILKEKRSQFDQIFIVTESIFSMDGDTCDLKQLVEIKNEFNALLYIDEAHAVGAVGEKGLGLSEKLNVIEEVDFIVGTMGKALSSVGAFFICTHSVKQWMINKCRPFIYTTALPPINMAWSKFIYEKITSYNDRRIQLKSISYQLQKEFNESGIEIDCQSHIIPIVIGENDATIQLSEYLFRQGFLVMPIRPPTVPQGTSRLRLSLSSSMKWEKLKPLVKEISTHLNKSNAK